MMFAVPVSVILFFSQPILVAIGNDPDVANIAQDFLRTYIPGFYSYFIFDITRKFL